MDCPRCGFSQPDDRFCANCGLNVETYRAKPKPLIQRLLSNPASYLVAGVLATFTLIWWAKHTPTSAPERNGIAATSSAPIASSDIQGNPQPAPLPSVYPKVSPSREAPDARGASEAKTDPNAASAPARASQEKAMTAAETEGGTAQPALRVTQVDINYYEIARDSWQTLVQDGKNVGEQTVFRLLSFSQKEKLNGALAQARRLSGGRQMSNRPSSQTQLHFPLGGTDPSMGLFFDLSVVRAEGNSIELELAGQIGLKQEGNTELHGKIETVASLPIGGALVVITQIQRRPIQESMVQAALTTPLAALESADFMEGQSELIMVIQSK